MGIFESVCTKRGPAGGGDKNQFSVCVWPNFFWPNEKKGRGTLLYEFEVFSKVVENERQLPFLTNGEVYRSIFSWSMCNISGTLAEGFSRMTFIV